jgi:hypothetical protein
VPGGAEPERDRDPEHAVIGHPAQPRHDVVENRRVCGGYPCHDAPVQVIDTAQR